MIYGKKDINFIVQYFKQHMKGMKSVEYKIWARSFSMKEKHKFEYLTIIQNRLREIRSLRLDINFNIKNNHFSLRK